MSTFLSNLSSDRLAAFMFITCYIMNIGADFGVTSRLTNMEHKSWWDNLPEYSTYYKHRTNFAVMISIKAIYWACMVHLPIVMVSFMIEGTQYVKSSTIFMTMAVQASIDGVCDHFNFNTKKRLTMLQGHIIHLVQITSLVAFYHYMLGLC